MKLRTRNLERRPFAKAGFTLLEIMLAVLILGIGLIMVAMLFPVAADQQRRAASEAMASEVATNAFGVLESRLKRNYFTYPGTYTYPDSDPRTRHPLPNDKPKTGTTVRQLMDDFVQAANDPRKLADPEKTPWPPGAWTFMTDPTGLGYGKSVTSDYPDTNAPGAAPNPGCFYTYCYLRLRTCAGDSNYNPAHGMIVFFPWHASTTQGLEMFALDLRVTRRDRAENYCVYADTLQSEWCWDFCLRMDPSGAMHAIVFVMRSTDRTGGGEQPIVWMQPSADSDQDPAAQYWLITRPDFATDFMYSSNYRTSGTETWVVSRLDGSVQRQTGWVQTAVNVWAPLWYANSAPKNLPLGYPNSQGNIITCSHGSGRRSVNPTTGVVGGSNAYFDPTVAVFSKVLKLAN